MKTSSFSNALNKEIARFVANERGHIGGQAHEIHTMNLLFGAFFNKTTLTHTHREIMKSLQGFEVQTLIVDKALDDANISAKECAKRAIAGFILQAAMTDKFYSAINKLKLPSGIKFNAIKIWNETLLHIYFGEGIDVLYTGKKIKPMSLKEYLFIIRESTAKFIQLSLMLGSLCSKKTKNEADLIQKYGLALGLAFQIRDDFYDRYKDLQEKKQRVFVTKEALQKLDSVKRNLVIKSYPKVPQKTINIVKSSPTLIRYVKNLNREYLDNAVSHLKSLPDEPYKHKLIKIAELLAI